jgi:hypothetical protein
MDTQKSYLSSVQQDKINHHFLTFLDCTMVSGFCRWVLCGFAVLLVLLNLLDEGLELALQGENEETSGNFLVSPFGFWWCLKPEVSLDEMMAEEAAAQHSLTSRRSSSGGRLSELSPLLGESVSFFCVLYAACIFSSPPTFIVRDCTNFPYTVDTFAKISKVANMRLSTFDLNNMS